MQRTDTPSTFRLILNMLACVTIPPEPLPEDQVLLLNPSEPDLFAEDESEDELAVNNAGPSYSITMSKDGFYSECFEEISRCNNVVCCAGLCCMGACSCTCLVAGCMPVFAIIPGPVIATFTPLMQAITLILLPFGGMFAGLGAGALCWGQSMEAANRWEEGRTEKNQSTSVCGFFYWCCRLNKKEPQSASPAPLKMGI